MSLPLRLVHLGSIEASGFLIETLHIGEREGQRRVLAWWTPGATVHRVEDGWILRLATPVRLRGEESPGLPLVAQRGVLAGLPLREKELTASAGVVLARAGRIESIPLPAALNPAEWIDLPELIVEVESLGELPPMIAVVTPKPADELLVGRLKPSPERDALLGSLAKREADRRKPSLFVRLLQRLFPAGAPSATSASPINAAPLLKLLDRIASVMVPDVVARWLARKHGRHLAKVFDLFERGDLEEALRHAIPLGGEGADALRRLPPMQVFRRRGGLDLFEGLRDGRGGGALALSGGLYGDLAKLYRAGADRLKHQGKWKEAAFVFARLMNAPHEAVSFLEREGQLRLAAEVAEAYELPAGLVVRQWWLAKDRERAVLVARRTGAFADAIARLQTSDLNAAEALRREWVDLLLDAGDLRRALDVLQHASAPDLLERERAVLDEALQRDDQFAAMAVVRKLERQPDAWSAIEARAKELLAASAKDPSLAHAFAHAVAAGLRTKQAADPGALRALAKPLLRRAITFGDDSSRKQLSKVDDPLFLNDLPDSFPTPPPPEPLTLVVGSQDRGIHPAFDAALLRDGRMLVALGESGVRLYTRDGRIAAEFDVPAHQLVVSEHGDRAIAVARRGEVSLLSRIDLLQRTAKVWDELRLVAFSETYDGAAWIAADEKRLHVLDTLGERVRSVWSVATEDRRVMALSVEPTSFAAILAGSETETWQYELPTMRLARRIPSPDCQVILGSAVSPEGDTAFDVLTGVEQTLERRWVVSGEEKDTREPPEFDPRPCVLRARRVARAVPSSSGAEVVFRHLDAPNGRCLLEAASRVSLRLDDRHLVLCDDLGRVLALDASKWQLVRSLRVG